LFTSKIVINVRYGLYGATCRFVPPSSISAPERDGTTVELSAQLYNDAGDGKKRARMSSKMLPIYSGLGSYLPHARTHQYGTLRFGGELKGFFGAIYRLNRRRDGPSQGALPFDALKSDQLTGGFGCAVESTSKTRRSDGSKFRSVRSLEQTGMARRRGMACRGFTTTAVSRLSLPKRHEFGQYSVPKAHTPWTTSVIQLQILMPKTLM
jgi:hypothetical protein